MKEHVRCCPYCDGLVYICKSDFGWKCSSCPEEWSFEESGWENPSSITWKKLTTHDRVGIRAGEILSIGAGPYTKLQQWVAQELKDSYGRQNNTALAC